MTGELTYGEEVILDLHCCRPEQFTRRKIELFLEQLCEALDLERCDLHWWDDLESEEHEKETEPHLVGTSAVQFIKTSNIVIHTLDLLERVYLNVFSCGEVDPRTVERIAIEWFGGHVVQSQKVTRQ